MDNLLQKICLPLIGIWLFAAVQQASGQCGANTTISLQGESGTLAYTCAGDDLPSVLGFRSSSVGVPYVLAVTDEQGKILLLSNRLSIDFDRLPPGNYRVYVLSFIGGLLAQPGMNVFSDRLGFLCYSISSNYIHVQHVIPDGGRIGFTDVAGDRRLVCSKSSTPEVVSFSTSSPDAGYRYFLTDAQNIILEILSGDSYDFSTLEGPRRVWGASVAGKVTVGAGMNITSAAISAACFDLSENFLEIVPVLPEESNVRFAGAGDFVRQCSNDGRNPSLVLEHSASGAIPYIYVLTDDSNRFIRFISEPSVQAADLAAGRYRIYGLSYIGAPTGEVGRALSASVLSTKCYQLSENFVVLEVYDLSPGQISVGEDQSTNLVLCANRGEGAQQATFNFPQTPLPGIRYALLVLDEQKRVLHLDTTGRSVDFSSIPGNRFFVSGMAYEGRLLLRAGDELASSGFAEGCFALSPNAVFVEKKNPDGGMLRFEEGGDTREICYTPGADPGAFQLRTTGQGGENYLFLLTDATKKILTISSSGLFDLLTYPGGTYRIYGLSYTGALSFASGAFIDQTNFSDECADLSDNFVSITKTGLDGARVRLQDGQVEALVCAIGEGVSELAMANTSSLLQSYAYLLTDMEDRVVRVFRDNRVSLLPLERGNYRVWGLAYSGELRTKAGDVITEALHSDGCFDLSQNFVLLRRRIVEGGTLATASGGTSFLGCIGTNDPLLVEVKFSRASIGDQSAFVLTDVNNGVLKVQTNPFFALSGFSAGTYRIWHVAHSGDFTATTLDNITTVMLSNECYDLSDNFITVTLDNVDGGAVAIAGDISTTRTICLGQGSGFLSLQSNSKAGGNYRYVLTNTSNQVIFTLIGASIDMSVAPPGEYRIYGISYTGRLLLGSNTNIREAVISDRCYALSNNFITIKNERVRGGVITFSSGSGDDRYVCPESAGGAQLIGFQRGASQGASYVYLITNGNGIIAGISATDSFDFSVLPIGEYRVWGLAYAGTLLARVGFNPASGPLVEGCASLSENSLIVRKINPTGGRVTLENNAGDTIYTCTQSSLPQRLRVVAEGLAGGQTIFLLTDKSLRILAVSPSGFFSPDSLPEGEYRIWSLAYNGLLLAKPGLQVDKDPLSQSCFGLSTNTVTVFHGPVAASGMSLRLTQPDSAAQVCAGGTNGTGGIVLSARTQTQGPFAFLVTDTLNKVLLVAQMPNTASKLDSAGYIRELSLALGQLPGGHLNIWGLAYTGNFQVRVGDSLTGSALSNGCSSLTRDPVRFFLPKVDGGRIRGVGFESDSIYVCAGDQVPDSIFFANSSQGVAAQYRYLLTNTANLIIAELTTDVQNFESIGFNELRIWGVSFTGAFISNRNKTLSSAVFSNGCFELSKNFLTIYRDRPVGGQVSAADNSTSIYFCPGRDEAVLRLKTSSRSRSGYVYLLTDTENTVSAILNSSDFMPGSITVGNYRIFGLSYTGKLLLKPGDKIDMTQRLSSSCFELSTNFIALTRGGEVDGQRLTTLFGDSLFYVCPGDGASDLVIAFPPANIPSGSSYVMVITDAQNRIIYPEVRNPLIDFEGAPAGVYRVWGISYTGILLTQFNTVLGSRPLSSDCYDLSENFITVVSEFPVGGTIRTADGRTDIAVISGDGKADKIGFVKTGASPNTPYLLLLTATDNTILRVIDTDTFDFESLPVGKYRMWGLAYSGILLAAPGANAGSSPLSDNCSSLSVNFVNIEVQPRPQVGAITRGFTALQQQESAARSFKVSASPNPTSGALRVYFHLDEASPEMIRLQLVSLSGQVLRVLHTRGVIGINEVSLELDGLGDGIYLLKAQSGREMEILKIVKTGSGAK